MLGILVLVAASWAANFYLTDSANQIKQRQQVQTIAEVLARGLSANIQQRTSLVHGLANQEITATALDMDEPEYLSQEQQRLAKLVPEALKVRLLPLGFSEPDTSATPNMGYASLLLLRQAEESSRTIAAEVHQFGTPHQHIAVASSVRDQLGEVKGVLHVAYPTQEFQSLLDALGSLSGRIEWQQVIPGKPPLMLAAKGGTATSKSQPDGVISIAGSIWQIAYWGSVGTVLDPVALGMQAAPAAILFLLAAVLLMMLSGRMTKALKMDQASILSLVEALVVGRPPKSQSALLSDLQPTFDVMEHQIREYRSNQAGKGASRTAATTGQTEMGISVEEGLPTVETAHEATALAPKVDISATIFRAYDIRGVVGETFSEDVVALLGQGFGSEVFERGHSAVVVGRDARNSSERLQSALIQGLQSSGRDVIDLGLVPTPLLHYAVHELDAECGAMITGSHNPSQYNGLKMIISGESPSSEAIQGLRRRIDADQLLVGEGSFDSRDIIEDYIERVVSDVRMGQSLKVVVDCGNGAASVVAPELYRQLGCEVVELYCDVDGDFPNHHPDPGDPSNMADLQKAVVDHQAALGIAFDGDGDRIGLVDSSGKIIWPDRLLMYLAIDVLTREPGGDIIYDVKCTRHLANVVLSNGGRPLMWKSGHSMLKQKMKETHALLAGEYSGHIIFSERWFGFDDGIYTGARLLEILSLDYRTSAEVFAELPESLSTPEYVVRLEEGHAETVMEAIDLLPDIPNARMVKIDGLRAEFEQGWGLVRASNTSPALLFRFEAESEAELDKVKGVFRELVNKVDPQLELPF
ncbi:MAG: phosphomannomutase/phosphoglucomutase [Candidatus Thiodiazotropha taylori]|nr:phosphomannomutase/phosphoglucomutase [Candidatus Thiodiazotropha taylori]MCG7995357.1 phosphomannomutase/phosphoglucomutase [Candidatus Thiodiazotropha taylori]